MRILAKSFVLMERMMPDTPGLPATASKYHFDRAERQIEVIMNDDKTLSRLRTLFKPTDAFPERFIIVSGNTSTVFSPEILPLLTSAFAVLLKTKSPKPSSDAASSTALLPALCRVFSYSFPGFPRPTITTVMRES